MELSPASSSERLIAHAEVAQIRYMTACRGTSDSVAINALRLAMDSANDAIRRSWDFGEQASSDTGPSHV